MSKIALTTEDRRTYRERLLKLTDRLSGGVAQLEDEALRPTGSEGTAADAPAREPAPRSSEAEEDVARAVLLSEERILTEARAALARLDEGMFGRCDRCGRAVAKERLDAVPYARHCVRCERAVEADA